MNIFTQYLIDILLFVLGIVMYFNYWSLLLSFVYYVFYFIRDLLIFIYYYPLYFIILLQLIFILYLLFVIKYK
jgi:hypothetical protein